MTDENFRRFLSRHHAVFMTYKDGDQAGLVNIWFYDGNFILTWEECKDGDQFNESNYTRDEAQTFADIDSVIAYLTAADLDIEQFSI